MNIRNMKSRINSLDGGQINTNLPTLFVVPVGEQLPNECDPSIHSVIRDDSPTALPAYGLNQLELAEILDAIDGKTRSK